MAPKPKLPDPASRPKGFESDAKLADLVRTPPSRQSVRRLSKRSGHSVTLPDYLWRQLKDRAHQEDSTQSLIIMKALKAAGFTVEQHDLVDGRKIR